MRPLRMAENRRRQRIVVVTIAVAHVAAEQNRGMIEHRSIRFLYRHELLDESGKYFGVVLLDLHQLVLFLRIVAVMGQRVECFGNVEIRVRTHAGFAIHRERDDAGDIRLEGEGHQIEHQLEMLGNVVGRADRRVRNVERGGILLRGHLHTTLDLADRVQVIADDNAVAHTKAGLQSFGLST